MLGAGRLVATLWKSGDERTGWRYRFNLFRQANDGRVGHQLRPTDVLSLIKLARVLASELATDGCLKAPLRNELRGLAAALDQILRAEN